MVLTGRLKLKKEDNNEKKIKKTQRKKNVGRLVSCVIGLVLAWLVNAQ
ncbi:hypothetical protein NC653_029204 [Populus alba x Populus x berolinensis]|uniref:Uncharacterized protein n=1 Tax=Populus alba x Populus x berolinensis TaxID=444605 RepID=A0AAD6Q2V8_9ROSI|nr:hypothetical protein NC653_029204 [Populus alba x Populus x berolinensis]